MREIKMLRGSSRKSKRLMKFFRMLKKEMHMIGSGMQVWGKALAVLKEREIFRGLPMRLVIFLEISLEGVPGSLRDEEEL